MVTPDDIQNMRDHAGETMIAARDALLEEGLDPLLVAQQAFRHAVWMLTIEHLNVEERLMMCDMAEHFAKTIKATIKDWNN